MTQVTTLFEDEAILIVHKPAAVHSVTLDHDGGGRALADELVELYPFLREVADRPGDAGLINRLDFGTSGILIGAKTRAAWEILRSDIQNGRIWKRYLAVVGGTPPKETTIENFIGSPYRRSKKVRVYESLPADGRALPATSTFHLRESNAEHNASLVEIEAPTARRHQIRVHAKTLGYPLIGDELYGSERKLHEIFTTPGLEGFCLHAFRAELLHPVTKAPLTFVDPAPEYLREIFRSSL